MIVVARLPFHTILSGQEFIHFPNAHTLDAATIIEPLVGLSGVRVNVIGNELLPVTPALAEAVRQNLPPAELRRKAGAAGFRDMLDDGVAKILDGLTSVAEVLRSAGARRN